MYNAREYTYFMAETMLSTNTIIETIHGYLLKTISINIKNICMVYVYMN